MNSSKHGKNTLKCRITSINELGMWLIIQDKEYFVPFKFYPEFKKAPLNLILSVKLISPTQLRWEKLDYDIEITALSKPDQYPLHFSSKMK